MLNGSERVRAVLRGQTRTRQEAPDMADFRRVLARNELLCIELCGVVWKLRQEGQKWFRAALSSVLRFGLGAPEVVSRRLRSLSEVCPKSARSLPEAALKNFIFSKRLGCARAFHAQF